MNDDKIDQFLQQELPHLPPLAAGERFNFVDEVLGFLRKWHSAYCSSIPLGHPAYCCFVGHERITDAVKATEGFSERALFRDDTPPDLLGHCYFCSFPFNRVYAKANKMANLDECMAFIEELGGSDQPFIIFNAPARRVFWRARKAEPLHQVVLSEGSVVKFTSGHFEEALQRFHIDYTETPEGLCNPWENAKQLLTQSHLEAGIRNHLYVFMKYEMEDCHAVIREYQAPAGRADLKIYFHAERKAIFIELKVLREFRRNKNGRKHVPEKVNIRWGKKGIAQAYAYKRSQRGAAIAYACCFDARKDNEELPQLVDLAEKCGVLYKRYFMCSSTDQLHDSITN